MLLRHLGIALAGLLLMLAVPFLAGGALFAALYAQAHESLHGLWKSSCYIHTQPPQRAPCRQFGFDRAIEAYELLIDSACAQRPA